MDIFTKQLYGNMKTRDINFKRIKRSLNEQARGDGGGKEKRDVLAGLDLLPLRTDRTKEGLRLEFSALGASPITPMDDVSRMY